MRHPFDGIIQSNESPGSSEVGDEVLFSTIYRRNRRSFLRMVAAGATAIVGLLIGPSTKRFRAAQLDLRSANRRSHVTTQSLGEEGGGTVTTQAVGEEGGGDRPRPPRPQPHPTTYALGEEGAGGGAPLGPRRQLLRPH